MKVAIITYDYPQCTEVYVEDEVRYLVSQGLQVAVWAYSKAPAPEPVLPGVHFECATPMNEFLDRVQPDVIHLHWLHWAKEALDFLASYKKPVTVRAHTDTSLERLQLYTAHPVVKRLFIQPGQRQRFGFDHPKLVKCLIGVAPPGSHPVPRDRRQVLRAASNNARNQTLLADVAEALPDFNFRLCLAECTHVSAKANMLALNARLSLPLDNLRVDWNVSRQGMEQCYQRAGIYLLTFPFDKVPVHPISIPQAMSNGCYVIVPHHPHLVDLIGEAGASYRNLAEACALIAATREWSEAQWQAAEARSRKQAEASLTTVAYKDLIPTWQNLRH